MAAYRPLVRIDGETHVLPDEDRVPVAAIEGAVADDDPRLIDAREWTAETVDQAEAEARTATTRRAWTAQRVGQAIAAWWATVGTTVGKALVNLTNPSAIRFIRINADNSVTARTAAEFRSDIGAGTGSGTVTSVGLSVPTGFSIANSPVTGAGTLTLTFAAGYQGYTTAEAIKLADIADNANNYTLPAATATVLGGIELFSNTVQSVAANAVSATASRTYGVQVNSDGQAVVNVPWVDTNTTYSGSTSITLSSGSFQRAALSGDVTASANSNATTIANNAVSNAKLADMVASSIKGRVTAGTGDPEDLTAAQVRTLLNVADGATTNQTDAYLLARANHTGTQPHTTITGLGTAATANVTTSATDTTAGRVLKVRDFGLGVGVSISDFNAISVASGTAISFSTTFQPANRPPGANLYTGVAWAPQGGGGQTTVICADTGGNLYRRQHTGANWQGWVSLLTSDSTIPSTNISGLGTAATANVTTSATDTAAGRVLTVGYGGLHVPTSIADFSTIAVGRNRNVLFSSSFGATDRPPTVANYSSGIVFGHNVAGGYESMLVTGASDHETGGALYIKNKVDDVWQPWRRVLDSKSLVTGNGDTTASRIPTVSWVQSYAASTDVATTSSNGLMSAADKVTFDNMLFTEIIDGQSNARYVFRPLAQSAGSGHPLPIYSTYQAYRTGLVMDGDGRVEMVAQNNSGGTRASVRLTTSALLISGVPTVRISVSGSAIWPSLSIDGSAGFWRPDANTLAVTIDNSTRLSVSTTALSSTVPIDINGQTVGKRVNVPATATSTGVVGDWASDNDHLYCCHATNTWRRVALSTW